ncbi:MAG TPA: M20 family metallopeptidase [Pseudonocardia sp.]
MDLVDDARALRGDLGELRRALHAEPEVGLRLPRTQERVLEALRGLPLEISTGTEVSSVTAVLRGGRRTDDPTTVLLRGDMDALPVTERSGEPFAAHNGAMHACGHDLHTAALVGAARLLCALADRLTGDVVFMFQPGEEGWNGAGLMIDEGVLDAAGRRADHAYALHVWSTGLADGLPTGAVASRAGTILSASYDLDVTVRGVGGHGSMPHTARDPVAAAAEMVTALQTAVTRSFDVFDPVVLTVGVLRAGSRRNVIPDTASFEATVRGFSAGIENQMRDVFTRTLRGVAEAHGVRVDVSLAECNPATVNAGAEVDFAGEVARELFGDDRYRTIRNPVSASEDFSRVLSSVPGAMLIVGACPGSVDPAAGPPNHSPLVRFDEDVLVPSAALYAGLAATRLSG